MLCPIFFFFLILNLLDRELANTDRSDGVLRLKPMPCRRYLLHSGTYFGNHKHPGPESNVWFHKTGTEQIIDNKWGLLSTHLNLLLITGGRQCRNANEPALGAVRIRRVSNTSFGKVFIGAYIMDVFKSLPARISSVELSSCSLMSWSVHFHRDIHCVWLPNLTAPLPFISLLPLTLSAQALRTTEGINCLFN